MLRRLLILAGALAAGALLFFATLPDVRPLATSFPKTTAFMERRKSQLAREQESSKLEWSPVVISRIAPALRGAVVAAEDARFYEHGGVDWEAVRGALRKNWQRRKLRLGGSTITQQLAKNLYLSPARTPWRKLREWAIARRLESNLSKNRILELYLNVIEFGHRTYGAEAASRRYFGKTAASLTAWEAATLAAVIPSPRLYDPSRHPARVARRARRILRRMQLPPAARPLRPLKEEEEDELSVRAESVAVTPAPLPAETSLETPPTPVEGTPVTPTPEPPAIPASPTPSPWELGVPQAIHGRHPRLGGHWSQREESPSGEEPRAAGAEAQRGTRRVVADPPRIRASHEPMRQQVPSKRERRWAGAHVLPLDQGVRETARPPAKITRTSSWSLTRHTCYPRRVFSFYREKGTHETWLPRSCCPCSGAAPVRLFTEGRHD